MLSHLFGAGESYAIYILCVIYAIHMVEEFTKGFVPWANRYFGNFNWTQNIIGNSI